MIVKESVLRCECNAQSGIVVSKKRTKRSGGSGASETSERAFPIEIAVEVRGNEIRDAMGRSFHIDADYYVHKQIIPAAVRILQIFGYDASYFAESPQKNLSIWL